MYSTAPSWSIPGKYKDKNNQNSNTPSPNNYQPQKWVTDHSPSWKIGNSLRNGCNQNGKYAKQMNGPGPGQYEPYKQNVNHVDYGQNKSNGKQLGKFNQQNYQKLEINQNPSPNCYSPNYKINRPASPSMTISSKVKQNKQNIVPGPGRYDLNLSSHNSKSQVNIKFGIQKRFQTQKIYGPGPQTYAPIKNNFKKVYVGFTKSDKHSRSHYQTQPGPGQYQTVDLFQSSLKQNRGYSIAPKHQKRSNNQNPGPGQYNPSFNGNLTRSPYVSMKGKYENQKIEKKPGPSQYFKENCANSMKKGQQIAYSIGKSLRDHTNYVKNNPGPGAYDPKSLCNETPKYSLYGSRIREPREFSPGPGAYNADKNVLKKRPQSAKIGKSKRCQIQKSTNPGPGAYQYKSRPSTPCTTFTRQQRNKEMGSISPGPADYSINPIFGTVQNYVK